MKKEEALEATIALTAATAATIAKQRDTLLTENRKLRIALRESLRYLESTDGSVGDLFGCAVKVHEFVNWDRLANNKDNEK